MVRFRKRVLGLFMDFLRLKPPSIHGDGCTCPHLIANIGVAWGGKGAMAPPKCLGNIVIWCLGTRFSKQNSVIRRTSNILAPPNFWAGYPTDCEVSSRTYVRVSVCLSYR